MSIKASGWILASLLCLSACSEDKPVVIEPGAFTEKWPTALRGKLVKNKRCAIDSINGKSPHQATLTFKSGEALTLSGWMFSKTDGTPSGVFVQLVGPALTYTALAQKRTARLDVNRYYSLDADWRPGFELQAGQAAEPGVYRLEILQPGDRDIAQCDTKVEITIDPAVNRT